jgi:hypothetical protein
MIITIAVWAVCYFIIAIPVAILIGKGIKEGGSSGTD